jgi:hypothetical protein
MRSVAISEIGMRSGTLGLGSKEGFRVWQFFGGVICVASEGSVVDEMRSELKISPLLIK